jgi:hypothetical protein
MAEAAPYIAKICSIMCNFLTPRLRLTVEQRAT